MKTTGIYLVVGLLIIVGWWKSKKQNAPPNKPIASIQFEDKATPQKALPPKISAVEYSKNNQKNQFHSLPQDFENERKKYEESMAVSKSSRPQYEPPNSETMAQEKEKYIKILNKSAQEKGYLVSSPEEEKNVYGE